MWETISHEAIDVNTHVQLQKASFSCYKYAVSKIFPNIVTGLILLAQNRDYNRSPTPVYDMAPFLHCACVRSAIFLASKTAASNSKLYGESFGQCKKTAIKS